MKISKRTICSLLAVFILLILSTTANAFADVVKTDNLDGAKSDVIVNERLNYTQTSMSDEELSNYYETNAICPRMPEGSDSEISNRSQLRNHLSERFPEYSWGSPQQTDSAHKYLSNVNGHNPQNINEEDEWMVNAKIAADLPSQKKFVGCGAIAMMEAFNYLSEVLDYISLKKYPTNNITSDHIDKNRYEIALSVIKNTPSTGWWGKGTSIMPSSFLTGAKGVLEDHGLLIKSDNYSAIDVYGDVVSRNETLSQKISTIKQAIDRGTQIIWWTGAEFGNFSDHYMNIIGYEDWTGVDGNGNKKTHTFIALNYNHQHRTLQFVDQDVFSSQTMGFIFFEPHQGNIAITQDRINIAENYNNTATTRSFLYENGSDFHMEYLRMAYIKHYSDSDGTINDGKYLALSPNKSGAGVAYFKAGAPAYIKRIHIDVSWWRVKDRYTSSKGELKLQALNPDTGEWITFFDFLNPGLITISTDLNNPTKLQIPINNGSCFFRIYATYDNPTSSRNNGRFIIHGINLLC